MPSIRLTMSPLSSTIPGLAKVLGAVLLGSLFWASPASAQTPPGQAISVKTTDMPACTLDGVKVTSVSPATVAMESVVTVRGENLAKLDCASKPIVLFLDSLPLKGIDAEHSADGLRFRLKLNKDSKANWSLLLGSPDQQEKKGVPLSVGYADSLPVASNAKVDFVVLPVAGMIAGIAVFVGLGIVFVYLATHSNIIREGPSNDLASRGPFSLSRAQAAWWFFVVLGAYFFIGLLTGDFTTSFNRTALILLAIGGGTAIGGALIGNSQSTPANQALQQIAADAAQAKADVAHSAADEAKAATPSTVLSTTTVGQAPSRASLTYAATVALARASAVQGVADRLNAVASNKSQGFLIDILSDADGVCFHRFQMAAWTIVLAGVFFNGVYETLTMPDFDATLFGLLGISSATYLGLKNTEAVVPAAT